MAFADGEIVKLPDLGPGRRQWDPILAQVLKLKEGQAVRLPPITAKQYGSLRQTLSYRMSRLKPGYVASTKTIGEWLYIYLRRAEVK